ncbi:MAG TPA: YbhB/YbcL family Raf kinase inhibitor-like protein [Candidatus Acidoferrales bacterium]|nr:YbhB/YbcL family Raf kinase inhibitor-like protein [Candidatus Acidoferrales bacterium]
MNVRVLVLASVFLTATAAAYPTPLATPIIPAGIPTLTITSATFSNGGTFPSANVTVGCGANAANISPQLSWTPGPPGTASYTIHMFDTDAPTGIGFNHWVVFNIPGNVTSLAANAASTGMPPGAIIGLNDGGTSAYRGPCPPVGDRPHHYYITITALDRLFTGFGPEVTGARLEFLLSKSGAKILARGQYLGFYGR